MVTQLNRNIPIDLSEEIDSPEDSLEKIVLKTDLNSTLLSPTILDLPPLKLALILIYGTNQTLILNSPTN
jgi:hypothetical protein